MRDDVGGLQIAMREPRVVRELQRAAGDAEHLDRLGHADRAADVDLFAQAGPAEQFHHQERTALGVDVEVENGDDVRVAQLRRGAAFAQEPLARLDVGVGREQHLDRDIVTQAHPPGPVDLPHAPGAERAEDLVAAVDDSAGGQHAFSLLRADGPQ